MITTFICIYSYIYVNKHSNIYICQFVSTYTITQWLLRMMMMMIIIQIKTHFYCHSILSYIFIKATTIFIMMEVWCMWYHIGVGCRLTPGSTNRVHRISIAPHSKIEDDTFKMKKWIQHWMPNKKPMNKLYILLYMPNKPKRIDCDVFVCVQFDFIFCPLLFMSLWQR